MIYGTVASPSQLGKFLRAKRESLDPKTLNIPINNRRRVKGLRRSEVADRAGVGIDWYIALEQGRDVRASEHVLGYLGKALLMSPVEIDYLFVLAGRNPVIRKSYKRPEVNVTLLKTIKKLNPFPAYILDISWDVIAFNTAAEELWGFSKNSSNNLLWMTFINPYNNEEHWIWLTDYFIRSFRRQVGLYPDHPRLHQLIIDLKIRSERFRSLWENIDVRDTEGGTKQLIHPLKGLIKYNFTALSITEIPGAYLFIYTDI